MDKSTADPRDLTPAGRRLLSIPALGETHAGRRVKDPSEPHIYLVMEGRLRWIPNGEVMERLFDDWVCDEIPGLTAVPEHPLIPYGREFGEKSCIVKREGESSIWLFDGTNSTHVPNWQTYQFYNFEGSFVGNPDDKACDPDDDDSLLLNLIAWAAWLLL